MRSLKYLILGVSLALPACVPHRPQDVRSPASAPAGDGGRIRIGVYDSRAVAMAYCGSAHHEAENSQLEQALEAARKSGDAHQIRKADRTLWESRKRLHRQAFSTHPVDGILSGMPEDLDRIRQELDITILVSRWDAKTLRARKKGEQVDVTERLVQVLTVSERRRRQAMDVVKRKPLPPITCELLLMMEAGKHY